jgi:hypothetical protein
VLDDVLANDRPKRAQHLELLVAHVVRPVARRRLHREDAEQL